MKSRSSLLALFVLATLVLGDGLPGSAASPNDADTQPVSQPSEQSLERFEASRIRMGVPFRITLYACDEAAANKLFDAAFARIRDLDRICSDYDPESELMRLCSSATPGKPHPVSADLFTVVCSAQHYARVSRGAFDVTVGPLVQLWRTARRKRELPEPEQLTEAMERTGYLCLTLDQSKRTITLHREKMRLDLGGIAKGFAGDAALVVLRQHGCSRALIDCGGDVVAGDPPPGRDGWVIGIAPLTDPQGKPSRYLSIRNQSVATSGDAFHYSEIDGVRYSHIVNPKTGLGLTRRSSVTVIAPSGIAADALASAVSVLGCEQGLAIIDQSPDHAALYVEMSDDGPSATASRRLTCYEVTP